MCGFGLYCVALCCIALFCAVLYGVCVVMVLFGVVWCCFLVALVVTRSRVRAVRTRWWSTPLRCLSLSVLNEDVLYVATTHLKRHHKAEMHCTCDNDVTSNCELQLWTATLSIVCGVLVDEGVCGASIRFPRADGHGAILQQLSWFFAPTLHCHSACLTHGLSLVVGAVIGCVSAASPVQCFTHLACRSLRSTVSNMPSPRFVPDS